MYSWRVSSAVKRSFGHQTQTIFPQKKNKKDHCKPPDNDHPRDFEKVVVIDRYNKQEKWNLVLSKSGRYRQVVATDRWSTEQVQLCAFISKSRTHYIGAGGGAAHTGGGAETQGAGEAA